MYNFLSLYIYICNIHIVGIVVDYKMITWLIISINLIVKVKFGLKRTYILDLKLNLISFIRLIRII